MEWQPIETAPTNKDILVYQPEWGEQFVVCWSFKYRRWQFSPHDLLKDSPTHWMPLPEPPNATQTP